VAEFIEKNASNLYCVAVEVHERGKVINTHLVYVHAHDAKHAARIYRQSEPNSARHHIVTAGKAIAYRVQDTQGLILSA